MERAATWDLDGFWYTDSSRPQIIVQHGQIQRLDWPSFQFFLDHPTGREPFLIGSGPEPGCHWRTFTDQLLHLLKGWGCEEIYLLGSVSDQIFHDEVVVSGVAQDIRGVNQIHKLGCDLIEYKGPTAIHGAIMDAVSDLEIYCLSLWAHFPFYINGPHELLMANLIKLLGKLLGVEVETLHLEEAWLEHEREIEDLIDQDPELRQMLDSMNEPSLREAPQRGSKVIRLDEFLKRRQAMEPENEDD
jgi:proteasome assembly chaperone (PAC2) family protein